MTKGISGEVKSSWAALQDVSYCSSYFLGLVLSTLWFMSHMTSVVAEISGRSVSQPTLTVDLWKIGVLSKAGGRFYLGWGRSGRTVSFEAAGTALSSQSVCVLAKVSVCDVIVVSCWRVTGQNRFLSQQCPAWHIKFYMASPLCMITVSWSLLGHVTGQRSWCTFQVNSCQST